MKNKIFREGLVFGVIFLFLFSSVVPISIGDNVKLSDIKGQSSIRGNTLYVGGSGPNNYTKIQDAIDDAFDGDIVFVYNYSSPYYESLIINKSIQLCGRNRENTIIDGYNNSDTIILNHDNLIISNFTIQNCGEIRCLIGIFNCINVAISNNFLIAKDKSTAIRVFILGVSPMNSEILIKGNIIKDATVCIELGSCYIEIEDNLIDNTIYGIIAYDDSHSTIINNTIKNCFTGILLLYANENNIYHNNFLNCKIGINLEGNNNTIQWNEFTECLYYGISVHLGRNNEIHFNNFIKNNISAYFRWDSPRFCLNHWNKNYWDNHHTILPKIIPGIIQYGDPHFPNGNISWFQFDWLPSKEPYDI
jgi:parallel beta-helix repeat protein